jgi:hypothetical protein
MGEAYPPSTHPQFRIGRDSCGHWVVQDERGLYGGLFVDRAQALKYALFENGNHPQAVIMVPGIFELNLARGKQSTGTRYNSGHTARAA